MIATDPSCLTPNQLQDLAAGRLPGDRFARLLAHLDNCPECQERAQRLESSEDSLIAALASPPRTDPHSAEADCLAVLHAAARSRQNPLEPSTPSVEQLGPYRLIRPLGSGGMGAVFLARHTRLRRECAVKLLPRNRGLDATWRERFDREMAAVAALNDPHVVAASDAGEAEGWHFLVMEYLDGLDLSRLAGRMGPLAIADACELARQAAVGLAHVHSVGLVHRDIKPSNLMLTREGIVKILDLGLVLSDQDPLPADDRLTTVGQLMGTLAYMAPEQLVDSTTVDHRADLYALGATLFRLLTAAPPHASARGIAPLVLAKTHHPAPDIAQFRSDLTAPLVSIITSLLDRDPDRRPQSATAVADALQPHALGANPKRLITAAQRKRPSSEESASHTLASFPVMAAGAVLPPRRPRSWQKFLAAAAALPLLVLAGITLVIMTDRGQLVIESEAGGLAVSIEQGDEMVEQLQLATGENRVTLRSGTYTVTLDAQADGLQISDQRATIIRGQETVLRVRREPLSAESAITGGNDAGPRYRGETFGHWKEILGNERDVDTVVEAMKAVVELSRSEDVDDESSSNANDNKRAEAAEAMLKAAHRFGGMTHRTPGRIGSGLDSSSSRFMGHLLILYPALLPHPGLDQISNELAVGNEESAMAAIYLLHNYASGLRIEELYVPEFGQLEKWSETAEGRAKLRELADHIDRAVERLGGYQLPLPPSFFLPVEDNPASAAISLAYEIRLRLNELLDVDPFEDPAIADRLGRSIESVATHTKKLFEQAGAVQPDAARSDRPRPLSQLEVTAAAAEWEPEVVAWAVIPSLLQTYFPDDQVPRELLRRLGDEAPHATADALLALLWQRRVQPSGGFANMLGMGGGIGGMPGSADPPISLHPGNQALIAHAIELIGRFTTKPQPALELLQRTHAQLEQGYAFKGMEKTREALDAAIEQLEKRVGE